MCLLFSGAPGMGAIESVNFADYIRGCRMTGAGRHLEFCGKIIIYFMFLPIK